MHVSCALCHATPPFRPMYGPVHVGAIAAGGALVITRGKSAAEAVPMSANVETVASKCCRMNSPEGPPTHG